jgi:hypothetical protein
MSTIFKAPSSSKLQLVLPASMQMSLVRGNGGASMSSVMRPPLRLMVGLRRFSFMGTVSTCFVRGGIGQTA